MIEIRPRCNPSSPPSLHLSSLSSSQRLKCSSACFLTDVSVPRLSHRANGNAKYAAYLSYFKSISCDADVLWPPGSDRWVKLLLSITPRPTSAQSARGTAGVAGRRASHYPPVSVIVTSYQAECVAHHVLAACVTADLPPDTETRDRLGQRKSSPASLRNSDRRCKET